MESVVEHESILALGLFSFLACLRHGSQRVVPVALERVGHQAVVRVDPHESALRQIGVQLRALDRATAEVIGLVGPRLDLATNVQRQLDGRRRHLSGDQLADRPVDRRSGDGLAVGLTVRAGRAIADIPRFLPSAACRIPDTKVPAAAAAHGATLQQGGALARRRGARHFVSAPVGLEDLEIVLESLPADVARMRIGQTGEPLFGVPLALDLLPAIGRASIPSASVDVGAGVAGDCNAPRIAAEAVGGRNTVPYGSRSLRGTQVAAVFYTLCETARLAAVDPQAYLLHAVYAAIAQPGAITFPEALIPVATTN